MENPQRIIGPAMGPGNDNPVVYWVAPGAEQCVGYLLSGNLDELEKAVKETHKNNHEHLTDYLTFIEAVRSYQKAFMKAK